MVLSMDLADWLFVLVAGVILTLTIVRYNYRRAYWHGFADGYKSGFLAAVPSMSHVSPTSSQEVRL